MSYCNHDWKQMETTEITCVCCGAKYHRPLEDWERIAEAEAYRCGFEAGKVESDLWGEAATTIKELEAELDTFRDASLLLTGKLDDAQAELTTIKEKARAAVSAPYDDVLDMGLAQALRELKETIPE